MDVLEKVQQILDNALLPFGVISSHLRRTETDRIENSDVSVNKDEYVVFRVVSNPARSFGDGVQTLKRVYIDVNYYYRYGKTDAATTGVKDRLQAVKTQILSDKHFRLVNDLKDTPDVDNPFRGFNVEFVYIGAADNG